MPSAPIRFAPQILAKPWGGGSQLRAWGFPVPEVPPTGEVWLVSDVPGKSSRIVSGPGAGGTLEDLLRRDAREVLGDARLLAGRFPILVKLLEVRGALSLQVHPDAEQAQRNGDGASGKFEAWSVLGTAPGARTTLGFDTELRPAEVRALVANAMLQHRLNTFDAQAGDAYVLAPGTVHAARGGLLLLEVQETADVTYRLYDWGAVGLDGRPRELHLEKALAVARLAPLSPRRPPRPVPLDAGPGLRRRTIVSAGAGPFVYELVDLEVGTRLEVGGDRRPWVVIGVEGVPQLEGEPLPVGAAALWPGGTAAATVNATSVRATVALAAPAV
ncbi:MAG: type I phosphomannose isomerase catalytic subunit [Planctomycetota bacterium]